jgi:hypothetical protein
MGALSERARTPQSLHFLDDFPSIMASPLLQR